jgi:hypothetical protein
MLILVDESKKITRDQLIDRGPGAGGQVQGGVSIGATQAADMITRYLKKAEDLKFGITPDNHIVAAVWFDITKLMEIVKGGYDGIRFYFGMANESEPTECPGRRPTLIAIGTRDKRDVGFDPTTFEPLASMENCECGTGTRIRCTSCPSAPGTSDTPLADEGAFFLKYAQKVAEARNAYPIANGKATQGSTSGEKKA